MVLLSLTHLLFLTLLACGSVHSGCGPNHFLPLLEEVEPRCPEVEDCALNCRFGLGKNSDGCDVCECQHHPCNEEGCKFPRKVEDYELPCEKVGDCERRAKYRGCPNIVCQTKCPFGLMQNMAGCRICVCNPSSCNNHSCGIGNRCIDDLFTCANRPCDAVPKCVKACPLLLECTKTCDYTGFKRDENGCRLCECKQQVCDDVRCPANQHCIRDLQYLLKYQCACDNLDKCELQCEYGYHRDINGCAQCLCVQDPCKGVSCPGKRICQPSQLQVCLHKPCPFKAKCVSP